MLRITDRHFSSEIPQGNPCKRQTWLIQGKLFTLSIYEEHETEESALERLDALAAAANDIALGCESFRDMAILPFTLDPQFPPRAILGFNRHVGHADVRVILYAPGMGTQLVRGNG